MAVRSNHLPMGSKKRISLLAMTDIKCWRRGDARELMMARPESQASPQRGRIVDARGIRVTQLDPIALLLLHKYDIVDADSLRTIADTKGVRVTRGEKAALIGGACAALLVIALFVYALISGDIRDATIAKSSGLLYLCSVFWIIWFAIKRKRFKYVAAAMLEQRRCPHCGYDLRSLPTEASDGVTICPECGCAWQLGGASD